MKCAAPRTLLLPVAAVVLVTAACAEAADDGRTPSARPAPPPPTPGSVAPATTATSDVRTLEVEVGEGRVTPAPSQVDLGVGETLRLVVTSDRDTELHAHGFDVDAAVPAGEPTSIDLVGTTAGVFEVELHDPDLLLLQVAVR